VEGKYDRQPSRSVRSQRRVGTCRTIDARYHAGPVATDSRTKGDFQARAIGDLVEMIGFTHYLALACVGLLFALIATTTIMAVQDRIREHALLQTLGFSGPLLFGMVLTESLLVSLAGGLLGVALGSFLLNWAGLAIGTEGVLIALTSSWAVAATGLAITVLVGIGAGLVPAWQASRAEIVTSLRQV
jgi:putative ABC transport system permease protein